MLQTAAIASEPEPSYYQFWTFLLLSSMIGQEKQTQLFFRERVEHHISFSRHCLKQGVVSSAKLIQKLSFSDSSRSQRAAAKRLTCPIPAE
jgi:hypothetical protein